MRLFPTRTAASAACDGGQVKVGGTSAKPATQIKVGDRLEVPGRHGKRSIEVVTLIEKRVGAAIAATALIDHTPVTPPTERPAVAFQRERGAGRPTKKDRRELDRMRAEHEHQ